LSPLLAHSQIAVAAPSSSRQDKNILTRSNTHGTSSVADKLATLHTTLTTVREHLNGEPCQTAIVTQLLQYR
jgi:hypothetical protein